MCGLSVLIDQHSLTCQYVCVVCRLFILPLHIIGISVGVWIIKHLEVIRVDLNEIWGPIGPLFPIMSTLISSHLKPVSLVSAKVKNKITVYPVRYC